MSNLIAGSVTYTVKNLRTLSNSRKHNRIQLAFGDGSLTYPTGGIPITIGNLGCPRVVESAAVVDQGASGYKFQYDTANSKLIMIYGGSHTHDIFLRDNVAGADTSTLKIGAAANKLGANTGANLTITGIAAAGGNGGIVAAVAGAGGEPSGIAIAAQTVILEVIGY